MQHTQLIYGTGYRHKWHPVGSCIKLAPYAHNRVSSEEVSHGSDQHHNSYRYPGYAHYKIERAFEYVRCEHFGRFHHNSYFLLFIVGILKFYSSVRSNHVKLSSQQGISISSTSPILSLSFFLSVTGDVTTDPFT